MFACVSIEGAYIQPDTDWIPEIAVKPPRKAGGGTGSVKPGKGGKNKLAKAKGGLAKNSTKAKNGSKRRLFKNIFFLLSFFVFDAIFLAKFLENFADF